jgi:glycosyltransferase involved in cell wall biosynthesis
VVNPVLDLAVIVLTKNEEAHVAECLQSVSGLARELLVVDSKSEDNTVDICVANGARVFTHGFVNFSAQRNAALDLTNCDWVFFLDADERFTPELRDEVRQKLARATEPHSAAAFAVPRRNYFFGRLVRHAGWSPDYQIRLLKRGLSRYDESRAVHEFPMVKGRIENLGCPLVHLNYDTVREFMVKQEGYAAREAQTLQASGTRYKPHNLIFQPVREFRRRYLTLNGYRDGLLGMELCLLMAYYSFRTYVYLRQVAPVPDSSGRQLTETNDSPMLAPPSNNLKEKSEEPDHRLNACGSQKADQHIIRSSPTDVFHG